MVIESPASRRPRAGARLRWSRPHVAPVEGPGLLPGLSIPWLQGSTRSSISAGTCHGKDCGRFDRSATAARRQPASGSSTGTPPDETALPRGRSPPGAMSCPEQPSDSCSRRSLLQCNGQSDMWHEQAVVVHLGFDGRDEHAPPGRGECRSGGPLHGRCAGSGQWPGARRPGRSPSRRLAGAAPGPLWCPCRLRAAPVAVLLPEVLDV